MTNHPLDASPLGRSLLTLGGRQAGADASRVLSRIAGVGFAGGHEALFDLGPAVAEMNLAADGSLRLRAEVASPAHELDALSAGGLLPGNVRFARDRRGWSVVADTQINGAAHLPRTLQWIRAGMCRALDAEPPAPTEDSATIERGDLERALAQLPWAGEGVVEQDYGWELRPRVQGEVVPVRMTLDRAEVCVTRVVLAWPPARSPASTAVADQAVRFNNQLCHARLAARDGSLVAEARLHGGLVEPAWLGQAAYAVAQAARHAATPLRILAEQPLVAQTYLAVFCSTVEQPARNRAGL
jgi:hypothetical protein